DALIPLTPTSPPRGEGEGEHNCHLRHKSDFDQHPTGRLDYVFDTLEERHRFPAIDDPMVVSQGQIHHGPDHDVTLSRDGPFLNCVHAENTALWWIHDGCRKQRTVNTSVADRKSAAVKFVRHQLIFFGAAREIRNCQLDLGE